MEQGREVFAVPGPIGGRSIGAATGSSRAGAKLVTSVRGRARRDRPRADGAGRGRRGCARPAAALAPEERSLVDALAGGVLHVDELVRRTRPTPVGRSRRCSRSSSADSSRSGPGCGSSALACGGTRLMAKNLVIVESPAKAKTLTKYLGRDYQVKASVGPRRGPAEVEARRRHRERLRARVPRSSTARRRSSTSSRRRRKDKENIYLAPDPDREGEAIAWHIAREARRPEQEERPPRALQRDHEEGRAGGASTNPRELDTQPLRRAAGAPRARPPRRLPDLARSSGTRCAAGCRPGACSRSRCA